MLAILSIRTQGFAQKVHSQVCIGHQPRKFLGGVRIIRKFLTKKSRSKCIFLNNSWVDDFGKSRVDGLYVPEKGCRKFSVYICMTRKLKRFFTYRYKSRVHFENFQRIRASKRGSFRYLLVHFLS